MARDSFIFYRSYAEALSRLPNDQFATIMKAIFSYAYDGKVGDLGIVESVIFDIIKPQIDANEKKYQNGCKGADYGKLGGRPKKPQENPTETPNDNDNVNDNDNDNDKKEIDTIVSTKKKREKPTFDDVISFAIEQDCEHLARGFFNFCNGNDWKDNAGNEIKNWRWYFLAWKKQDLEAQERKAQLSREFDEMTSYEDIFPVKGGG